MKIEYHFRMEIEESKILLISMRSFRKTVKSDIKYELYSC